MGQQSLLKTILAASLALACCLPTITGAQVSSEMPLGFRETVYHGLRPTDPGGRNGLLNPERGLRIETMIAEPHGRNEATHGTPAHLRGKTGPGFSELNWVRDIQRFGPDGVTVGQMYCYLTDYADRPLPAEKLALLQDAFDLMRQNGVKALLRFAYEKDYPNNKTGPTKDRILTHIEQLKDILQRNADVIYVLQAGFIGAWGEWHSAAHIRSDDSQARAEILKAIIELCPSNRMTQVRVPRYKSASIARLTGQPARPLTEALAFTGFPEARVGFHNDGVLAGPSHGGTWTEAPLFGKPGNPEFDVMTRESAWVPVDGELFWSDLGWKEWAGSDGKGRPPEAVDVARYLRLHHFTTLSLAHSYSEREGPLFAMDRWRVASVDRETLAVARLPVSDGWFEDAFGQPVSRTLFEYLRDHLGYRLELAKCRLPKSVASRDPLRAELELVNRGFAAPVNVRQALLALIAPDEKTVVELPIQTDPRRWQPSSPADTNYVTLTHRLAQTSRLPPNLRPGAYLVGLWLPDPAPPLRLDPRYAIRLANRDTSWWTDRAGRYGINLVGTIQIEE